MIIGAIVGATGVGKTEISLELAQRLEAEIISIDSRQIYQGLRIGTAQPTQVQRNAVRHHLVDFLLPHQAYSAAMCLRDVRQINDGNNQQRFLLVGGTGFYFQALSQGLSLLPEANADVRTYLEQIAERKGQAFLYRWAQRIDPQAMQKIHPGDRQRIQRVLDVYLQTGQRFSQAQNERQGAVGEFPIVWLNRSRNELYQRIDDRVLQMLEMGWLEETQQALSQGFAETCPGLQGIGYRTLVQVIQGDLAYEDAVVRIQQDTRRYAKRQLSWFRNQQKNHEMCLNGQKKGALSEIIEKSEFFFTKGVAKGLGGI